MLDRTAEMARASTEAQATKKVATKQVAPQQVATETESDALDETGVASPARNALARIGGWLQRAWPWLKYVVGLALAGLALWALAGRTGKVQIGVRPEKLRLGSSEGNSLSGTVAESAYIGDVNAAASFLAMCFCLAVGGALAYRKAAFAWMAAALVLGTAMWMTQSRTPVAA